MVTTSNPRENYLSGSPWPHFEEDEVLAAAEVLRSGKVNYWTGTQGREFEREFAAHFGVAHSIAMANGTLTLQAAIRVLGIGEGDEVVTTPRTFIGTSSSIVLEGARPVLAEVDRDSGNITAETIERVLTPRTKAIMPVHLAGWPCEMDEIMALAKAHNLYVIEDCAQSHGALYKGKHLGSIGHIGSWSYCQDKIMTTGGEGGMIGTDDEALWSAMWSYKDHGKSYDAVYHREHAPGFRWLHETWGTNYRLTEPQSAIGRIQLRKLPSWTEARTRHAHIYESRLRPLTAIRMPEVPAHLTHAYYKLYGYVRPEALRPDWSRDRIIAEFAARGIPALSGTCSEIYLERAFQDFGLAPAERFPIAQELGETSLMFLVHPTLTDDIVSRMADEIADVLTQATR
ncbi:MAG: DegT/DnrJ/EryC1/StrS family aminotransferase [Fimbriimonas sp.]